MRILQVSDNIPVEIRHLVNTKPIHEEIFFNKNKHYKLMDFFV